jgi:hypothetical protein
LKVKRRSPVDFQADLNRYDGCQEGRMKLKLVGYVAALIALFGTAANAATKAAASGGGCPLCR